jgi:putative oxidoreductase
MVGWLTRLAAVPVVISMGVAAFVAHAGDPLSSETAAKAFFAGRSTTWVSKEPALLFLIVFLAFFFTGAGGLSIDEAIRRRRARPR